MKAAEMRKAQEKLWSRTCSHCSKKIQVSPSSYPCSYLTASPTVKVNQKSLSERTHEKKSRGLSIPEHRATQDGRH